MLKMLATIIYHVSGLFARDECLWVFGSQTRKSYTCNPKHLFLYASKRLKSSVECVWVSEDHQLVKKLQAQGLNAVYFYSVRGVWTCLRASKYFVNVSHRDISFWLSKGASVVNLWHGVPLKKIGFDNDLRKSRAEKRVSWVPSDGLRRLLNPKRFSTYDYVLSSSDYVTSYSLVSAFDMEFERFLPFGFPRNDLLFETQSNILSYISKYEDGSTLDLVAWCKGYSKVFMYMPTYRDTKADFIESSSVDFVDLDKRLKEANHCLVLKLHPATKLLLDLAKLTNIKQVNGLFDVYPFLPFVDVLITDYSSIYFDFVLLDRPIIFFAFDLQCYMSSCRGMYLDYNSVTPGDKVKTYGELCDSMFSLEDRWGAARQQVRTRFWGQQPGSSSAKLCKYLLSQAEPIPKIES
ncbi:CDP-glycerol glycerophosphotransferase family protein [Pseudomonas japonica]|uniref:CDP-glycerol glycerophosphotransferase family protein n=1 Tax=Pseudomonas japonica TaxID=256466 RepID=UPI0015E467AB|nr:CDP-glycerol glycerophosphotransferase family protein [Pseudomonas japonica]MBA1287706.1 hypothetical protein [Pseudomonas japonica]